MAKYEHFEELPVWQEAAKLYNATLDLLQRSEPQLTGGFRGQLDRATISVSNNIAEGFEHATTAELLSFIARSRFRWRSALDDFGSKRPPRTQKLYALV
jgi:hypothetical protein